eukprot:gnl/MRDRNA2_/MRDRNA2_19383_c0_seq2.p1 gnl/MRDRNA2_/MRDRNA2_19383_c0~~gnl/MRDRNA2_/MRDRNA2_19383_c0_seq2.p1  ORF type:complete len:223 (-),score=33.64 gnl/MRDRNA2_/MRDRNA2_19383_c0_seq2:8-676(-)
MDFFEYKYHGILLEEEASQLASAKHLSKLSVILISASCLAVVRGAVPKHDDRDTWVNNLVDKLADNSSSKAVEYKPRLEGEEWFSLYCQHADPGAVAKAWVCSLTPDWRKYAEENFVTISRSLRLGILESSHPTVSEEKETGFKYTGLVMRAIDKELKVPAQRWQRLTATAPPPSGEPGSGPGRPICIIESGGAPGTLGIWWSDFVGSRIVATLHSDTSQAA